MKGSMEFREILEIRSNDVDNFSLVSSKNILNLTNLRCNGSIQKKGNKSVASENKKQL